MAREMTPQERADLKEIARKLVLQINEITPVQWDKRDDKGQAIILAAIKTARQEALREARDYALACVAERNKQAFELTKTVLNDPRAVWLGCKASEAERIAEWIDRLASEGG